MNGTIRRLLAGSALEPAARAVYRRVRPGDQNERYDALTRAIMRRVLRPDSNGVDVGAHRGSLLRELVRLAPAGRHHAFEPLPSLAGRLRRRFPSVRVHELALSDRAGRASFVHVVGRPGHSGFRLRPDEAARTGCETIEVETAPLDDVLDRDGPVAFIKVDVEGAEAAVLRGAAATLARWRPVVVFEHGVGAADAYDGATASVDETLRAAGLAIWTPDGWLAGGAALSRREFFDRYLAGADYQFVAAPCSGDNAAWRS